MAKIETGLHAHHASIQAAGPATQVNDSSRLKDRTEGSSSASEAGLIETPFARVNSVVEGSPADIAGLKAGDKIRSFGVANWMNHEKLSKVAEVVQRSEGVRCFSWMMGDWLMRAVAQCACQSL